MNINNSVKTFAAGVVVGNNNDMVCTLVIKTEQAANWYTQKITMPIDRSDKGKIYEYETFFYQNGANNAFNAPLNDLTEKVAYAGTKWN